MIIQEKSFSESLLQDLKTNLTVLLNKDTEKTAINKLISLIEIYQENKTISHPEVIKDLHSFIDKLSSIPNENSAIISDIAKKCCRECMFHLDDCFINIIYLIFESVKTKKYLEPNKIRPSLRIEAMQNSINTLSENLKSKDQNKSYSAKS